MESTLTGPLVIENMLNSKRLEPLDKKHIEELQRIQALKVRDFSEADVREEIITPLLRVMGYEKQSYFSIDREKPIKLLGRNKFPDYRLLLWSENFWVIEAKKPKKKFTYTDLRQALEYAVHPEINAALFVLCDGQKIEVYDREVSQIEPALTITISNIIKEIDYLRAALCPWQIWFFEKRRLLRQIDKVFDKEFNVQRLEEFRSLIDRRLASKRSIAVQNFQQRTFGDTDNSAQIDAIRNSDPFDLIEGTFFSQYSGAIDIEIAETLVSKCDPSDFHILYRIFPDDARDANDHFFGHALNFLIHLQRQKHAVTWLPSWLGGGKDIEVAVRRLIELSIQHFKTDPTRRNILLLASTMRRIFKALMVTRLDYWKEGEFLHLLNRFELPESSFEQFVSSPGRSNLLRLDRMVASNLVQVVLGCSDDNRRPKDGLLELRLREAWKMETTILQSVGNYPELLKQRNMGEMFSTEHNDVVYDFLGHLSLCIINQFPEWKDHTLQSHRPDVELLARFGSWQAKDWLGIDRETSLPGPTLEELSERFFLGDKLVCETLATCYGFL